MNILVGDSRRVRIIDRNQVRIETPLMHRAAFSAVFLFLTVTAAVSMEFPYDFSGNRLPGTLLIAALMLAALLKSLYVSGYRFDKRSNSVIFSYGFGRLQLRSVELGTLDAVEYFSEKRIGVVKEREEIYGKTHFSSYLAKRAAVYQLNMKMKNTGEIALMETSGRERAENAAQVIRRFTGKPLKHERA